MDGFAAAGPSYPLHREPTNGDVAAKVDARSAGDSPVLNQNLMSRTEPRALDKKVTPIAWSLHEQGETEGTAAGDCTVEDNALLLRCYCVCTSRRRPENTKHAPALVLLSCRPMTCANSQDSSAPRPADPLTLFGTWTSVQSSRRSVSETVMLPFRWPSSLPSGR